MRQKSPPTPTPLPTSSIFEFLDIESACTKLVLWRWEGWDGCVRVEALEVGAWRVEDEEREEFDDEGRVDFVDIVDFAGGRGLVSVDFGTWDVGAEVELVGGGWCRSLLGVV